MIYYTVSSQISMNVSRRHSPAVLTKPARTPMAVMIVSAVLASSGNKKLTAVCETKLVSSERTLDLHIKIMSFCFLYIFIMMQ